VGDFSGGENDPNARGQFKYVTQKIEYLKQLGVNASMSIKQISCLRIQTHFVSSS
jgi:1,4-alpha-glucan branching enzyme